MASNILALGLGLALGAVVTPMLYHGLGTERFGAWSIALNIAVYLTLAEGGIGLATMTRIAALTSPIPEEVSGITRAASAVAAVGALVGVVALIAVVLLVPSHLEGTDSAVVAVTIALTGAGALVGVLGTVRSGVLIGLGRMHVNTLSGFAVSTLTSVSWIVLLALGQGLRSLALASLLGAVAQLTVSAAQIRRTIGRVAFSPLSASWPQVRQLYGLAWRNSVASIGGVISVGSDVLVIGLLLSPARAAAYALAQRAYQLVQALAARIAESFAAVHAATKHHGGAEDQFRIYVVSVRASLLVALPAALTLLAFGPDLLGLWIGDVPAGTARVLTILSCVLVLQLPGYSAYQVLMATERAYMLTRLALFGAVGNLALSLIFTSTLGVVGPALGTLIGVVVIDCVILPIRLCRELGKSPGVLIGQAITPFFRPAAAAATPLIIGRVLSDGTISVIISLTLAATAYVVIAWSSPVGQDLRVVMERLRSA